MENNAKKDNSFKFRKMRKKVCVLCKDENFDLDYKNPEALRRFINEQGKILPRRVTGTCAKHQRQVAETVKRARHIAVIAYKED